MTDQIYLQIQYICKIKPHVKKKEEPVLSMLREVLQRSTV